jgi:hypothetical protein
VPYVGAALSREGRLIRGVDRLGSGVFFDLQPIGDRRSEGLPCLPAALEKLMGKASGSSILARGDSRKRVLK